MGSKLGRAALDGAPFERILKFTTLCLVGLVVACSRSEPPRRYILQGQILAVSPERQQLTIKHDDIRGFMPGMTMSFDLARPELLAGRQAGDLVTATLEVTDSAGRLTDITKTGSAPLDSSEAAMAANILSEGDAAPDAAFIDQNDRRRALTEWRGTATLVTFIYTRCPLPTFCPLMDQNFATIQRNVAEDALLRGKVKLISISFDPTHDTPPVLAAHAQKLKADPDVWTFLTGDRVTVDRTAAKFGVGVMREDRSPAEIVHNLRTALIDPGWRIAKIYSGSDWTTATVLADLRALYTR